MSELLAPAGSMEALKAAIANGCDAVYLGLQRYGARAYSDNFDERGVEEAVAYAHLRGVKVYVTMNTIVFEDELDAIRQQLHFLNNVGVDGVIAQDLAVLEYTAQNFEDMEAHCSTQMGIDDVQGALLAKELGAKRVVIARETPLEKAKDIRRQADIAVEAFVHGALCISYSGNCIMSGMTGNRSGNRGRCIGSCRKLYDVVDVSPHAHEERVLGRGYILSTKDLNVVDHVDRLDGIDSLKIEGRMKEPAYVANVVSRYRMALDGTASREDKEKLNRTFNRTYTEGYLLGEDRGRITNVEKPNHHGFRIGAVAGFRKGLCELALTADLRQNDLIRIRHDGEDVNLAAAKIYDAQGRLVNGAQAGSSCFIRVKERLTRGDAVYKTKDLQYEKELESLLEGEFQRFPLNMTVHARPGAALMVEAEGLGQRCVYEGDEILAEAVNQPTAKEAVVKQLARLNDTVFRLGEVEYEELGAFVPAKMLNAARKDVVERLYAQKLASKPRRLRQGEEPARPDVEIATEDGATANGRPLPRLLHEGAPEAPCPYRADESSMPAPLLCAFVATQEQYDACKSAGLETVYFRNVVPRNSAEYAPLEGEVLVGGMGGIHHYRTTNPFVTDYSLNVTNSRSCRTLHLLGARRVTLSFEMNEWQIRDLVDTYCRDYGHAPSLEMVVYGHAPLLVTKHCPLKRLGQCGACRTHRYEIRDDRSAFPLMKHENCDTTVLNGKPLNLLDEMPRLAKLPGMTAFRLQFTLESADEVREIIAQARGKLSGSLPQQVFNPQTDTRGYFNKEIL
ncbi:MAG: U32 family peptidase [Eggerthellaceae bacterium]|nr:U32 family peptidase [Eggerthellaceae bacterium]